jgi:hypothetical protein
VRGYSNSSQVRSGSPRIYAGFLASSASAEQRDEPAALHVDFSWLDVIVALASACRPASVIFMRTISTLRPPTTMRSTVGEDSGIKFTRWKCRNTLLMEHL